MASESVVVQQASRARWLVSLSVALPCFFSACTLVVGAEPTRDRSAARAMDAAASDQDAQEPQPEGAVPALDAGGAERDAVVDAPASEGGSDASQADAAARDASSLADADRDGEVDAACTGPARLYYPDEDGDGYGRSNEARSACAKPAGSWAERGGDCRDNAADVHPGQTRYFGTAYMPGDSDSFDYDCSGVEEGDPAQNVLPGCAAILNLALCGGSGYEARTERQRAGVNSVCGSNAYGTCQPGALLCGPSTITTVEERYRCH